MLKVLVIYFDQKLFYYFLQEHIFHYYIIFYGILNKENDQNNKPIPFLHLSTYNILHHMLYYILNILDINPIVFNFMLYIHIDTQNKYL